MGYTVLVRPATVDFSLVVSPRPGRGVFFDVFTGVKKWADKHLHTLPDIEEECRVYFSRMYESVSPGIKIYFAVEELVSEVDGSRRKAACRVLGPGESVVDAYSTSLLSGSLTSSVDPGHRREGAFTVGTKTDDGELVFTRTGDIYDATVRQAYEAYRSKLKKLVAELPFDDSALPDSVARAVFWRDVVQNYSGELSQRGVLDRVNALNAEYTRAEAAFSNAVRRYQENVDRAAQGAMATMFLNLAVTLATAAGDAADAAANREQLARIEANQRALSVQLNGISTEASRLSDEINVSSRRMIQFMRAQNLPINDSPRAPMDYRGYRSRYRSGPP